jgi:hypothetical protein
MEWLVPWHSIADETAEAAGLERELSRELSAGHRLCGVPVRALGRRQDCDDVLFALEDGTGRVAVVHLTWTQSPPDKPPWPATGIYRSFEAWLAEGMRADHDEIQAGSPK